MPEQLYAAWQLRRVLIVGGADDMTHYAAALLQALGAQIVLLSPKADTAALNGALSRARIHALLIPSAHALAEQETPSAHLHALERLLGEAREAGVPLVILCSHEDVYAPCRVAPVAREHAPLGGRTRAGLIQSILQLTADGYSRGLLGDPVRTIICRHAPCLGSDHPAAAQYSAWCRAILQGQTPVVHHPDAQGTFLHPLDVMLGVLRLGAHHLLIQSDTGGIYNLGDTPKNHCANRTAWKLLSASEGCLRACRYAFAPCPPARAALDGTHADDTCGLHMLLDVKQALAMLMAHQRALCISEEAAHMLRLDQAEALLRMLE